LCEEELNLMLEDKDNIPRVGGGGGGGR